MLLHRTVLPTALVAGLLSLCVPQEAHATVGLVLSDDEIAKVGDLTPEAREWIEEEVGPGVQIGYRYSGVGMLWMNIWTWDGEYVVYRATPYSDDIYEYWDATESEIAEYAGVESVDELGKPWRYRVPPGLVVIGSMFGLAFLFAQRKAARRRRLEALFDVPSYQAALQMVDTDGFDAAQRYLVSSHGVPPDAARDQLDQLLEILRQSRPLQPLS